MAATADREKALATALQQIEKQHGKGSIMRLGEQETVKIAAIPTGSVALDVALGVGGLPTWQDRGDLWSRILWQDDGGFARNR